MEGGRGMSRKGRAWILRLFTGQCMHEDVAFVAVFCFFDVGDC